MILSAASAARCEWVTMTTLAPSRAAARRWERTVDAVASFLGSYSLGLLITDRMYKNGSYNGREASIVAAGFSTVSATFMVIVAKTLDIMEHWIAYFFIAFIITFIVTAITVRIPPISRIPEDYYPVSYTHLTLPTSDLV